MREEQGVEAADFSGLPGLALGRGRPAALSSPTAIARNDRRLGKVQRHAETGRTAGRRASFLRRPDAAVHVALDADRVVEQLAALVYQLLDQPFESRAGVVIVDQQRGLRIGLAGTG